MARPVRPALSFLRALLIVLGAAGAALYALAKSSVLTLSSPQTVVCVAFIALAAILPPFLPGLGDARRLRQQNGVNKALRKVLARVIADCGLPWNEVGARFFQVRRSPWPFWSQHLVDIGHERFDTIASSSVRTYGKDKGVVGICWRRGNDTVIDLQDHFRNVSASNEAEWKALPSATTLGLSWSEYQGSTDLEVVGAFVAKRENGNFVGVISVEAPTTALACLKGDTLRKYIGSEADSLVDALSRS